MQCNFWNHEKYLLSVSLLFGNLGTSQHGCYNYYYSIWEQMTYVVKSISFSNVFLITLWKQYLCLTYLMFSLYTCNVSRIPFLRFHFRMYNTYPSVSLDDLILTSIKKFCTVGYGITSLLSETSVIRFRWWEITVNVK